MIGVVLPRALVSSAPPSGADDKPRKKRRRTKEQSDEKPAKKRGKPRKNSIQTTLAPFLVPVSPPTAVNPPEPASESTTVLPKLRIVLPAVKEADKVKTKPPIEPAEPEEDEEGTEEEGEGKGVPVGVRSFGCTNVGGRDENQDNFFELTYDDEYVPLTCCAWGVFDGHGTNGAFASRTAMDTIRRVLLPALKTSLSYKSAKTFIRKAFKAAHEELIEAAKNQPEDIAECGTTGLFFFFSLSWNINVTFFFCYSDGSYFASLWKTCDWLGRRFYGNCISTARLEYDSYFSFKKKQESLSPDFVPSPRTYTFCKKGIRSCH